MKTLLMACMATLVLTSCDKTIVCQFPDPEPSPTMKYVDLGNKSVSFNKSFAMDLNADGINDFFITTTLIGSPVDQQDYHDYYFNGNFHSYSPVNSEEEMPNLSKGALIGAQAFPQHEWYNSSQLLLCRRIIPMQGDPFWMGSWKDASHRFVPLSILKNGHHYYGWVELSFDKTQAAVILHKAAISILPDINVKAGL